MPFPGLSPPATRRRVFPASRPGRGCAAKLGSANGYTTLIVATSTSRYPDHSAAAYWLDAIRARSLVPSTANARFRSLMGGGLCRIRKAGGLVGAAGGAWRPTVCVRKRESGADGAQARDGARNLILRRNARNRPAGA